MLPQVRGRERERETEREQLVVPRMKPEPWLKEVNHLGSVPHEHEPLQIRGCVFCADCEQCVYMVRTCSS